MPFTNLGLLPELLHALEDLGHSKETPIQRQAIPIALDGKDIVAGAETGTGKTGAFTLPLLQLLNKKHQNSDKKPIVRALILTPTRELAAQVHASVCDYGKYLPFKSTEIFGGVNINPQIRKLNKGVDILVATPGRLLDHVSQGNVDLSQVKFLVLDEADRMLDMGFLPDVRKIIALLPDKRQNLLFSATLSKEITELGHKLLNSPVLIEVAHRNTAATTVKQVIHPVDKTRKRELLSFLIGSKNWKQVLVFTRTKHGANRLAKQLNSDGLKSTAIHGNKSQGARTKALEHFKDGTMRVLVGTDVASRGLDIKDLPHVVNFELPSVPEDYVHRIGRTGRAGKKGEAMSLVCVDELEELKNIERLLKITIPEVIVPDYEPDPSIQPQPKSKGKSSSGRGKTSSRSKDNSRGKSSSSRRKAPSKAPGKTSSGRRKAPSKAQGQASRRNKNKPRTR